MLTAKQVSELQRHVRTLGYQRIREAQGLPEPSEHDRKLRRARNERYRAKQRAKKEENHS